MANPKPASNPFYAVLIIVGMLFMLTACSYFVMTLQGREASYGRRLVPDDTALEARDYRASSTAFTSFMDRHGFTLLMVELGLLAAATFGQQSTARRVTRGKTDKTHRESRAAFLHSGGTLRWASQ